MGGHFIDIDVPYVDGNGQTRSADAQARQILDEARNLVAGGAPGVGITYSANYGQTRTITRTYFAGGWDTHTSGANQASVISRMEALLGNGYSALRGKMRVQPITTMNAYVDPVEGWNDDVLRGIVVTDLDRIETYLVAGWTVLGWQNQDSVEHPSHPYAVGGGVAHLPRDLSILVQQTLLGFRATYP